MPYIKTTYPSTWTNLQQEKSTVLGAIANFKCCESTSTTGHLNLNLTKDMRLKIKEGWSIRYKSFTLSTLTDFILGDSTRTDALIGWGCPRGHNFFARFNGITFANGINNWTLGAMFNFCDRLSVGAEGHFGDEGKFNSLFIL